MQLAKDNFDIPLVVRPEDLASPDLDELSGMTYLSYFMKIDSPGYFATLKIIQSLLKYGTCNNFAVSHFIKYRIYFLYNKFKTFDLYVTENQFSLYHTCIYTCVSSAI